MKKLIEFIKNVGFTLLIIVIIVASLLIYDFLKGRTEVGDFTAGSFISEPIVMFGGILNVEQFPETSATSTPLYMATSTSDGNVSRKAIEYGAEIDQVTFKMYAQASSTTVVIPWYFEFSDTVGCGSSTDPLIDWYGFDPTKPTSTPTTVMLYGAATTTSAWVPGDTEDTSKIFTIDVPPARCMKMTLQQDTTGDLKNYTIYVEALLKDSAQ